jgi:hypothetical protein
LTDRGWTDALRSLYPDERIYTFWDYFRNAWGRDAGLRLDHLLLSPATADRLEAAGVDRHVRGWDQASDHAPAWIKLGGTGKIALLHCLAERRSAVGALPCGPESRVGCRVFEDEQVG